jgi:hypothetical protein
MKAEVLLAYLRETMERLAETTPNCPLNIIQQFNDKYKNEKQIALPVEVNGIHKIEVYREEIHLPTPKDESKIKISFTSNK